MPHTDLKKALKSYAITFGVPYVLSKKIVSELYWSGKFSVPWFEDRIERGLTPIWPVDYSPDNYRALAKLDYRRLSDPDGHLSELAGYSLVDLRGVPGSPLHRAVSPFLRLVERPRVGLSGADRPD